MSVAPGVGLPALALGELDGVPVLPEDGPHGKHTRVEVVVAASAAAASTTTYTVRVKTLPAETASPTQLLLVTVRHTTALSLSCPGRATAHRSRCFLT